MTVASDELLYTDLLGIEDELLDISKGSQTSLESFLGRLGNVRQAVTHAIAGNTLTRKTASLIRNIASSGSILARAAARIECVRADVERKRCEQLEVALGRLTLEEERVDDTLAHGGFGANGSGPRYDRASCSKTDSPLKREAENSNVLSVPRHALLSYEWLRQHLHDPFPPPEVKKRISSEASVPEKTVQDWFVYTRRKIGWTGIMNKYFKKNRALTIDAAHVVLLQEHAKVPVCGEVRNAFLTMKKNADGLFDKKLKISAVAKQIDRSVMNAGAPRTAETFRSELCKSLSSGNNTPVACKRPRPDDEECSTIVAKRTRLSDLSEVGADSAHQKNKFESLELLETNVPELHGTKRKRGGSISSSSINNLKSSEELECLKPHPSAHAEKLSTGPLGTCLSPVDESFPSKRLRVSPGPSTCDREVIPGTSGAEKLDQASSEQVHAGTLDTGIPIKRLSTGALRISAPNLFDNFPRPRSLATGTEYSLLGEPDCDLFNVRGIVNHIALVPSEQHEYSVSQGSDCVDNLPAFGGLSMAGEMAEDPLAMLRPEDFGEDFAEFPGMPDLNIDWNSIPPPSLDSFLLPSDFSFSTSLPIPTVCGSNDEAQVSTSFGSDSTLADPLALSFSFPDKP